MIEIQENGNEISKIKGTCIQNKTVKKEVEIKGNQERKKMENENEIKKSQIKISNLAILQSQTNKKEILVDHVEANRKRIINDN